MLWSPAICDAVTLQLNWSSIFSRTGMPPGVHRYRIDNRSSASALCSPLAKYSEIASCPALRTLMPKRFFFCSKGSIFALLSTQTRISMGSSETAVNELAVMPWILPGSRSTVITVTPVVKWPRALRNSNGESGGHGILEVFEDTLLGGGRANRRFRIGCGAGANRMRGGTRNELRSYGERDRVSVRRTSRGCRAGVSNGAGGGKHP